jgi:hypothetical protein
MPQPRINLDPFRHEIELRIAAGDTHTQIRDWLATRGVHISKNVFSKRCVAWAVTRRTITPATDPALVSAIEAAFHTTQHDDATIATNIIAQGISTTRNQVEEIRLAHGWRRRANDDDQLAESRSKTFAIINQTLKQGHPCV